MTAEGKANDTLGSVVMGARAGEAISAAAGEAGALDGGAVVGRVLEELGVKVLFTVNGGHIWPVLATLREHGVRMIHMRHEQTCAYAADAWARTSGTPGVCSVTAGCGLTNAVTGLCTAALAGSAVVAIAGQHPTTEDAQGSFQEAYGSEICASFAKSVKRVLDWTTIEADVRQAFRAATGAPQGVALVEIPTNILYQRGDPADQRHAQRFYAPDELRAGADPRAIERAIAILAVSERPLIAVGDGVFWSDAALELRAFAELTGIPVYGRRAGQGALPEDHPLAVRGVWKKPFSGRADAVLAIGFRFWSGERFGEPPTWSANARYLQADATPARIGAHVPAEVAIVGDPKLVLAQLIERARAYDWQKLHGGEWQRELATVRENYQRTIAEQPETKDERVPIHPARLARELCEVLDDDATVVIDSFTMSGWMSQWLLARFPGQVLDAGPLAPVGHGIGMAIGAQLARPGRQVVAVMGDGGLGIGGFDLETARRYGLPIVVVLWNNSSWGPGFSEMPMLKGRTDAFEMLPELRYDRVAEALGCHGEFVTHPEQIRCALARALGAGKTALVNVIGDRSVGHPSLGGNLLGSTRV